ncbi:3-deoxy-D-manno-octulosonate 8-phosphate phosphatase, YrbI family [Fluviicola taffensis DSM 16823]|uniref:3-deoxy-D-manno-octulosonate 8-phosphate phosphatase, YrbI family n=2 Tax=Fluviicola TaxID=332102 RepID=F2IE22_FLUTR|nr:3-deoxy-D-manno-octulosonate 8-phosphate phosphatase, YrbI family [Fluviicola taffensis DSM 16823]
MFLEQNIKGLCAKFGVDFYEMLKDFDVDGVTELSILDLEAVAEEYEVDFYSLLFKPLFVFDHLKSKIEKIKLLILDVDGVMTDAGMYFAESGDQMKKYNAKDGMGIMKAQEKGLLCAIISSAFTDKMVLNRAEVLNIKHVYVGRDQKITILRQWCEELSISLSQVAMIGDDINDLSIMREIGLSACPKDAVQEVKKEVDIVLTKNGGAGVVREFIDNFLLSEPLKEY